MKEEEANKRWEALKKERQWLPDDEQLTVLAHNFGVEVWVIKWRLMVEKAI